MQSSPELEMIQEQKDLAQSYSLQLDFSWKTLRTLITEKHKPGSKPIYIVDYKTLTPTFIFRSGADDSPFASGTLHAVNINADCMIRGKPITLCAMKRFKTEYAYLSPAFSDSDTPIQMTWISTCGLKSWDFICLDPQQNAVAKFSANIWALKQFGNFEFLGPKASSAVAREEIVITGITLYTCMCLRANNVLSLFGAIFSHPGRVVNKESVSKDIAELIALEDRDRLSAERKLKNV
jgi:hypothetical protein